MAIYPVTDKTMLERILSGDEVNWQEFYRRYSGVVLVLCHAAGVPESCGDDIVQEVMSRFARNSSTYVYAPERARFRTYFNRIVRGAIADHFRKTAREKRICENLPEQEPWDLPVWERTELEAWRKAVLDEALSELASRVSSKNYLAFTMSTLQGHSIGETAEFIGISAAQVHQARSRCTAMLREIVQRCNEADPGLNLSLPEK